MLCVTFAENGDAITGDSSGNILVWGKGMFTHSILQALSIQSGPMRGVQSLLYECQYLHKYQNFKTAPSPFLSLIDLMGTAPVGLSVCLSACPLICPLQAVDLYVRPTEPSHPSHPISVTQALIASATSSKGLTRAASLLCPR